MDATNLGKDVWWLILNLCAPKDLHSLAQTCKKLHGWCAEEGRWRQFAQSSEFRLQEIDLEEKVSRIERIEGRLLALTESFRLTDVCRRHVLLEKVRDFACDQKTLVVCREVKGQFRFERYVWPDLKKPKEVSCPFASVAEKLCFAPTSDRVAACMNKTQVVRWNFELNQVIPFADVDLPVTSLRFDSDGKIRYRNGFMKGPTFSQRCQLGRERVLATDGALTIGKNRVMELGHLEFIQGVKSLFGGRAFVSLRDDGEVQLWFDAEENRVICEGHPDFRLVAGQLTVGSDEQGFPVIVYVMESKKIRIFTRESFLPQ